MDFDATVAEALELAAAGAMPLVLLPNDLGLQDGVFEWQPEELDQLVGALDRSFGKIDRSAHDDDYLIGVHPTLPIGLFVQKSEKGATVYYLDEPY